MKKPSKAVSSIIWALVYFGLVVATCACACFSFHDYYYVSFFVSGTSMEPTLLGGSFSGSKGVANYGIVDTSKTALKGIKRFDIVTVYYPWNKTDYILEVDPETGAEYYVPGHSHPDGVSPERKIKRVLGIPGETIKIVNGDLIVGKIPTVLTYSDYHEMVSIDDTSKLASIGEKSYKLGALPRDNNDYKMKIFNSGNSNNLYYTKDYASGTEFHISPIENTEEFYIFYNANGPDKEPLYKYINVCANGEKNKITYDMSPSTRWTLNKDHNTLVTMISDHSDMSFDGDYVFTVNEDLATQNTIDLVKLREAESKKLIMVNILDRNTEDAIVFSRELIKDNESYENYQLLKNYKENYLYPFERKFDQRPYSCKDQNSEVVLNEGRYWVQGDHWSSSTDSGDINHGPVYHENIEGILAAIEGTCTITVNGEGKRECTNYVRQIPKVYR